MVRIIFSGIRKIQYPVQVMKRARVISQRQPLISPCVRDVLISFEVFKDAPHTVVFSTHVTGKYGHA